MGIVSILIAILVFSFLIITHELGHFLFARRAGIGVIEFSVGMGPRIVSRQIGETRYSLKLIPFGGSCMMVGEDEDNPAPNAFGNQSVGARMLTVFGGPLFNILTAFILAIILLAMGGVNPAKVYTVYEGYGAAKAGIAQGDVIESINGSRILIGRDIELYLLAHPLDGSDVTVTYKRDGEKHTVTYSPHYSTYRMGISYSSDTGRAVLADVTAGGAAEKAGLKTGDVITAINGSPIASGRDLETYFSENPPDGSAIAISYERDGTAAETSVTPTYYEANILGFEAAYYREKAGPVRTVAASVVETGYWIRYTFASLKMLFTGQAHVSDMSGPVGIVSVISSTVTQSAQDGAPYVIMNLLNLSILLSVNLGVLNLLPLPALDGGRLLFLIIEAVRGKPVPQDKESMVHLAGFALLMVLMVFVMFNDIMRLIR